MSLGQELIGGLLDSTYKPSVNPDFFGIKNGKPVDKDGNPTTVYSQPNLVQRIVSPTARQYSGQNAQLGEQFATMQPMAQAQEQARMVTPTYANTQNQAAAYGLTGAPASVGSFGGQSDIANAKTMLASAQSGLNRSPVIQATQDAEAATKLGEAVNLDPLIVQHQINQMRTSLGQDPTEAQIIDNLNQAKLTTSGAEKKAAPLAAQTIGNQALVSAGLSSQQANDLPLTRGSMFDEDVLNNVYSGRRTPPSYFGTQVNDDGSVSTGHDPLGMSPAQASMGALSGLGSNPTGMGGGTVHTLPSGIVINTPTKPYSESPRLIGGSPSVNGQHDEAAQDIIDRHNKGVDAIHKSAQAEKDAQIAQLKAEKAKLAADHHATGLLPNLYRMGDLNQEDITSGGLGSKMLRGTMNTSDLIGKGLNSVGHFFYNND